MKQPSVQSQILKFLQNNPGNHHGGDLQRMEFKTRGGGLATGDSIKRRLQEMVESKEIHVSYNEKNEALFSADPPPKKQVWVVDDSLPPIKVNGQWRGQMKLVEISTG